MMGLKEQTVWKHIPSIVFINIILVLFLLSEHELLDLIHVPGIRWPVWKLLLSLVLSWNEMHIWSLYETFLISWNIQFSNMFLTFSASDLLSNVCTHDLNLGRISLLIINLLCYRLWIHDYIFDFTIPWAKTTFNLVVARMFCLDQALVRCI